MMSPGRVSCLSALLLLLGAEVSSAAGRAGGGGIPWQWSRAPDHYPLVALTARVRHQAWVLGELPVTVRPGHPRLTQAELRYELQKGGVRQVVWRRRLSTRRTLPGAALAVSGGRVFVARYGRIASTCTLHAFEAHTGRELWSVTLRGFGPVAHSKWWNRVQLQVLGGHPAVFGHEGPGTSYVEVRDAATGRLRSHRKLRSRLPPPPLAEALLLEVVDVLARAPVYRRTVGDFLAGHGLRIASPGVAIARLKVAVRQIDGLRLTAGYSVRARLLRQPGGAYLIEGRRR